MERRTLAQDLEDGIAEGNVYVPILNNPSPWIIKVVYPEKTHPMTTTFYVAGRESKTARFEYMGITNIDEVLAPLYQRMNWKGNTL